ncbi:MAG: imidazole glycerol phosphate synthase subunit HisH [Elusimicrobiota bacterium]|nr:MAG: imidazole glycerol phosphate synthase subunit HisH [Elusimicrobiota bacterium]
MSAASRVVIVDYGLGNLLSVARAVRAAGGEPEISSDPADVAGAERALLPGVGAFGDGIKGLRERGLVDPLRAYAKSGRPLLGICLGMQLLMDRSEEFGDHEGLGLVPGTVKRLPGGTGGLKLPHVGWSALKPASPWPGTPLAGTAAGAEFYFVHSFAAVPSDPSHRLADCGYGENDFCAALRRGSVVGCQFHPEKSGPAGLDILKRFLEAS